MKYSFSYSYILMSVASITLLLGCGGNPKLYVQANTTDVNLTIRDDAGIEGIISPYRDSLAQEMNEVIGYAPINLERDRPEGRLGNFVTDLTRERALREGWVTEQQSPIVIMNHGGLRSPINQGPIKRGDVFRLMPFDNTIVVLQLSSDKWDEIAAYIQRTGGEPISGFGLDAQGIDQRIKYGDTITVVTTDYLASGGDKMSFFQTPFSRRDYPILLRDMIMDHVIERDTVIPQIDGRIKL